MPRAIRTLPRSPRRYRFVLTPLADAMFQLLIFFMLASSLTPYSIMTLRSGPEAVAEGGAGTGEAAQQVGTLVAPETVLWTIDLKAVVVGGQVFDPADLIELAGALGSDDAPADVILIVRAGARVQDVASAMEALESANVRSVQITPDAG